MAINSNTTSVGLFIPTTFIFDVAELNRDNKESFKELIIRLTQYINTIAIAVNLKESGYYYQQEFVNGQAFFPNPALNSTTATQPVSRQAYRMVVNFGALPDNATTSVAHNIPINGSTTFTHIYGAATNTTTLDGIPLPYSSSTSNDCIELYVTSTDVVITTSIDYSAYNVTYIVIEYLKS
jgi:hypothetical protein